MKYIGKAEVVTGMLVVLCMVGYLSGGYNYEEPLGPDIIDGLMQIPPHVAKQYGKTDKVRLVSNIAELWVTRNDHKARIKALEQLVKELQAQVTELKDIILTDLTVSVEKIDSILAEMITPDPNEVAK